jgi:hypothetical protein
MPLKSGAEPGKGTVSFADGSFTYTPTTNANGAGPVATLGNPKRHGSDG